MRIKRVEIIGFKSFCDRAVLAIDQPITAVVGPNGCGKSNIVDAIRWCMGEQSAKHLRGKAMEDVIFAGSESRAGAPMAEVSLTFDDVGFSHEKLATAMASDEAAAEAAMATVDALAADDDADVEVIEQEPSLAEVVAEVAGDLAAAAPALGVDELGQPIASVADEVREMLATEAAPLDFTRYTEVTITRRLYRDGTSQYFINKVPCRLRDVTDFFLGTGVGTKAYSIIEQGRIGQIVSSRPADRRSIIEEAAGITKFKSKKKAAEKKLEQTKQNLLRVSDIVDELDKRMGTLRRQAQKAERYRTYKAELRDLELWKASHRYLELHADGARVKSRLEEAGGELEGVRAEWSTRDAQVVAERTELSIEERRLAGLQEAIYELDNRLRLTESKIGFETREAEDLEQRSANATIEIERLQRERELAAVQLVEQQEALAALAAEVGDGRDEVGRREAIAAEARTGLTAAQRQLDEARAALGAARTEVAKAEAQAESLARRQDEGQRRLARVCDELAQAETRLHEVDREAKRAVEALATARQTRLDLGSQRDGFEARRELLADQVGTSETQVETLRTELHRRRSRLQSLIEIQDRYEGFARGTRAVMQRASDVAPGAGADAIRGVVADVVRAPETLELAVEAALGDRLGGVLVADHAVGVAAVGYLKSHAAGRSTFVPVTAAAARTHALGARAVVGEPDDAQIEPSRDPAFGDGEAGEAGDGRLDTDVVGDPGEGGGGAASAWQRPVATGGGIIVEDRTALTAATIAIGGEGVLGRMVDLVGFADGFDHVGHSLLGDYVVVDSLERAVELHRAGAATTLVTLDGDLVDGRGVVSGGSRDASGAGVLAQKREIRELEEIVGHLEHDLSEATARLVTAKTELRQVQKALEGLRSEVHQGDIAIMGHEKDAARLRADHDRARERTGHLATERHELDERLGTMAAEHAAVVERQAAAVARADHFEREQLGLIDMLNAARELADTSVAAMTEARVRAAQLAEKRASLETATLRLAATDRDLGLRITRLGENMAADGARAESLRADAAGLSEELGGVRTRRGEQAAELDVGRRGYEERFSALTVGELAVRDLRGQADRLAAEVGQLEVRAASTAQALQIVLDGIMERYQLELAEVVPDFHQRAPSGPTQDERAQELRELIERMSGDINLTAIDEFGEVQRRHEFLTAQRADLESAVGQLERAIDKINKTSRRLFKETFAAVNATFKEVFPRLFRGGNAHLSLAGAKEGSSGEDLDVLEAGVEIFAQPPGKKNSTVDQLSGGEKALTAVALVFSIFLIKPSPFCILDEVDAPLDEANVDRYNEIVREMTDRSQFIVISHNKRTMESADSLYGVTMQEAGVSKLVNVNLSRLDQRRTAAA